MHVTSPLPPLAPYQQRVVDESIDLTRRLVALQAFLADPVKTATVAPPELALLTAQLSAMQAYSGILSVRIARWVREGSPLQFSG